MDAPDFNLLELTHRCVDVRHQIDQNSFQSNPISRFSGVVKTQGSATHGKKSQGQEENGDKSQLFHTLVLACTYAHLT